MKINFPAVLEQTIAVEALLPGQCFIKPIDRTEVFMSVGRIYGPMLYGSPVKPKKIATLNLGTGKRVAFDPDIPVIPVEAELTVTKIGRSA